MAVPPPRSPTAAARRPPAVDPAAGIAAEGRRVVAAEAAAVAGLTRHIDGAFVAAVQLLRGCRGRIVVSGVGKSGLVGQKISATLASVGAASFFVHATEAVHGDLGRICREDVLVALSNSGESAELGRMLQALRWLQVPVVALTAAPDSSLGRRADVVLGIGQLPEACPLGLAPTASSTAMLVLGDALALCVGGLAGLDHAGYARRHPAGALGRQLQRVGEVMRAGAANPVAPHTATLRQVVALMTQTPGRPGAAAVVDGAGLLVGFFTDGDLRRLLADGALDVDAPIAALMHREPKRVTPSTLVQRAVQLLRRHRIDQLPVVDEGQRPVGLLDVQDVLGGA